MTCQNSCGRDASAPLPVAPVRRAHLIEILEQRITPAAFSWNVAASGAWENPLNWQFSGGADGDGVPDADDTVTIDVGGEVTVSISSAQAARFAD